MCHHGRLPSPIDNVPDNPFRGCSTVSLADPGVPPPPFDKHNGHGIRLCPSPKPHDALSHDGLPPPPRARSWLPPPSFISSVASLEGGARAGTRSPLPRLRAFASSVFQLIRLKLRARTR